MSLNPIFFSRDFESVLDAIKWPYLGSASTELINPSNDSLNKLMTAAEYLFLVSEYQFGLNDASRRSIGML